MTHAGHLDEIRRINNHFMQRDALEGQLFEEISIAIYSAVIARGDSAADCGGNIGNHTVVMARAAGPSGRVYCFEPVPEMMLRAQQRNAHHTNITWIAKAAAAEPGTAEFFYYPQEIGLSGLHHRPAMTSEVRPLKVEVTTIDEEIEGPISLIKLDIEGAEFDALRGARRTLETYAPVLVFENGRQTSAASFGYSADDFFAYFEGLGYALYFISGMPFLRELWDEPMHPWQFIGLHKSAARSAKVLATTNLFLSNVMDG